MHTPSSEPPLSNIWGEKYIERIRERRKKPEKCNTLHDTTLHSTTLNNCFVALPCDAPESKQKL